MLWNGSAPTERTNINGILFVVSLYTKFIGTEAVLINIGPIDYFIYVVIAYTLCYGLTIFVIIKRSKGPIF